MRRLILVLPILLCLVACAEPQPEPPPLTRRQKDSAVAKLPVPGARGVGRALDVLEASEARAAALDSIR